jgi:hypothetical protein
LSKPVGAGLPQPNNQFYPIMFSMDSDEKRTVQAGRRRKTSEPGSEGRERAEAPQRRQPGGGSPRPPSGGGAGGPGLPGFPSGGRPRLSLVGIIIVILLAICGAPVLLMQDSGDTGEPAQALPTFEEQAQAQPTQAAPTSKPRRPDPGRCVRG